MKHVLAALVVALVAAPAAAAKVWKKPPPTQQEKLAAEGNAALAQARAAAVNANNGSGGQYQIQRSREAQDYARKAIAKFEAALAAGPQTADLHYRAFAAAHWYLPQDAEATHLTVIKHIDGMRAADPLDPRDLEITDSLCHALARLASLRGGKDAEPLYERAIGEYDKLAQRYEATDAQRARSMATWLSNSAELKMALGDLGGAIDYYDRAVQLDPRNPLNYYGLAIAYDRDGQARKGVDAMREAINQDRDLKWIREADQPDSSVYFVPAGDKNYYIALAYEVTGERALAIQHYNAYLAGTPSAQKAYLDRAREHLAELGKAGHGK